MDVFRQKLRSVAIIRYRVAVFIDEAYVIDRPVTDLKARNLNII
jgi:hypothetical protein